MSSELLLQNAANYTWQLIALIAVGMALPRLLKLREPRSQLLYLQALLIAGLLLPVLQTWRHPVRVAGGDTYSAAGVGVGGEVTTTAAWEWEQWVIAAMLAGTALRLLWLVLGLARLGRYRRSAAPLSLQAIDEARGAIETQAEVAQSPMVAGPVTFGYIKPLVLLPPGMTALTQEAQFAVVAHELLHVKRRDWLFTLAEESITAALWWNPAVWLLIARIRLVREQLIDREVVALSDSPQPYVEALLTLADSPLRASLAPNFLRRRHLAVRIQSLLNEVSMSRTRLIATYSLMTALATATVYLSTSAFPLQAAPQFDASTTRGVVGAEVVLRTPPVYPSLAKRKGIEGSVVVDVTIAANGSVSDARVLSGPQELRSAALEAVLKWQFKNGQTAQVTLNFSLTKDGGVPTGAKLGEIRIEGTSPEIAETLRARLAHLEGQPVNQVEIATIVREVAPSLGISVRTDAANSATLAIASASHTFGKGDGPRVRVGGNVMSAKMLNKVAPSYPPVAKQARIQGTVRFAALIAADGHVKELFAESGHPLLVESATEAVRQWTYQTTLLNGNPVEVLTAIDVNYTLSQ